MEGLKNLRLLSRNATAISPNRRFRCFSTFYYFLTKHVMLNEAWLNRFVLITMEYGSGNN